MEGGYSAVAADLSERFGLDPPIDRRLVYQWNRRRTENAEGRPFPSPTRRVAAKRGKPSLLFDFDAVAAWYAAGAPYRWNQGWETPAGRNYRYAHPTPRDIAMRRAASMK